MIQFGDKANVRVVVGRYHDNYTKGFSPFSLDANDNRVTFSYQAIELNSDPTKKFTIGAAYHHLANESVMKGHDKTGKEYGDKDLNLWEIGLGYRFDKNFKLSGAYARNASGDVTSKHRQSWHVTMNYKGADAKKQGSWGSYLSYRHLGYYATIFPTYNTGYGGAKGWQLGVQYTVLPNVLTTFEYWLGKNMLNDDKRQDTIFARAEIFF